MVQWGQILTKRLKAFQISLVDNGGCFAIGINEISTKKSIIYILISHDTSSNIVGSSVGFFRKSLLIMYASI